MQLDGYFDIKNSHYPDLWNSALWSCFYKTLRYEAKESC